MLGGGGVILLAAACAAAVALPAPVRVFEAYQPAPQPPCYRQPVLVVTPTALLAFAEGRFNTYCSGTADGPAPRPIVLRRSLDGGATWSAMSTVFSGSVDFLTALFDPARSAVHLFIQEGSTTMYTRSSDAGASWSAGAPLKFAFAPFKSAIPAVGTGIALAAALCGEPTCGGAVGRLIAPFICTDAAAPAPAAGPGDVSCPGCHSCLLVSDDGGGSWRLAAASVQDGSREASLVQLRAQAATPSAVVYASERNMGARNATGQRWHAVSADGGASFDAARYAFDAGLPDGVTANWTGVVSGAARFDAAGDAPAVVFTAPASRTARAGMTVYRSADETATWAAGATLWPGPAAYSSTFQLNATHVGVLFECGEDEFAQRISFLALAQGDLA